MEFLERRPRQTVYWSMSYRPYFFSFPVQHIISSSPEATFDHILRKVRAKTSNNGIVSFDYTVCKNLNCVIINNDESMKMAIEVMKETAFDARKGGIFIRLNEHESSVIPIIVNTYKFMIGFSIVWYFISLHIHYTINLISSLQEYFAFILDIREIMALNDLKNRVSEYVMKLSEFYCEITGNC